MNEYLTKPFSPKELFQHLRRFLTSETPVADVAPASKMGKVQKHYDLAYVKEMDDPEYTIEILQIFLETTPASLETLRQSILHEDWEAVYQMAHKLKSSVGILQMNALLTEITTIEQSAKELQNVERIPVVLKRVVKEFDLIKPMLEAELADAQKELC
jgi:HPt (histidine-containing phosphotransfer) domain-containing protein